MVEQLKANAGVLGSTPPLGNIFSMLEAAKILEINLHAMRI